MSENALPTRPVNSSEKVLRAKFAEQFAGQSEQMDSLARQLITLELAVPGLYAAALKLVQGKDATVGVNGWLIAAFAGWTLAIALTLVALYPRKWTVDPSMLKPDVAKQKDSSDTLSLEEFFYRSARYKRGLLTGAIVFFWLGIVGAVVAVL